MTPPSRILSLLTGALLVAHAFTQQNVAAQSLLAAANQERAARNLPILRLDPALTRAATAHALQMAAQRAISHRFPGEPELAHRAAAAGALFSRITENVAEAPSSLIVHKAWMQSPGHRENLLDPRVDAIGIAVVLRNGQLYAVQDFAQLTQPLPLTDQEAATAILLDRFGLTLLPETVRARATCAGDTPLARSEPRPAFILRYTTPTLDTLPDKLLHRLATHEFHAAAVGACPDVESAPFAAYRLAILLYP